MELGEGLPVQDRCERSDRPHLCVPVPQMSTVPVFYCLSERVCLGSVQGTFPGNLQLVLVLRPSRFFQKAIADIGIKLHKDDFKMKVPVSLLE